MSTTANTENRTIPALVIYLGLFLFAYTVPLAAPAKEQIAQSLGLAKAEDTWPVFTAYFLSWLIIIPPGAFLADRLGRKTMLLVGSLTLTIGMILFSMATDLPMACVAQFLNGAGAILLQIVGVAVITDLFAEKRGSALNLAIGIVGMIALLSPILMGELLAQKVSWTEVYRWSAILPATAFVVQLLCRFPAAAAAVQITAKDVGDLLTMPLFLVLISSMLVYAIVEQGVPTWAPEYVGEVVKEEFPLTAASSSADREAVRATTDRWKGIVVSAYFIIMSLIRTLVGLFRLFEKVRYPAMIAVNAGLGGLCLALGTLSDDRIMAVVCFAGVGAAIAQIWPSLMTYAVEATGKPTATVFGLMVGIGGALGVLLGTGGLGMIKQAGLTFQQSLLTLEIPLVLLFVVYGFIALTQRKPTPAASPPPA